MQNKHTLRLTRGAAIAAIYILLTELATLAGLSGGVIQFRFSEALCILPAFLPEAIPALFIGCAISNLLAGCMPLDILIGSLATLIGAIGAYLLRRHRYLIPLPTLLANLLLIPPLLAYVYDFPGSHLYFTLTVGIGELVCAYILGILLYGALDKHRNTLFK